MSLGYHAPVGGAFWDDGSESRYRRDLRERSAALARMTTALREARWANAVAVITRSGDGRCPLLARSGWSLPGWLPAGGMDAETRRAWYKGYEALERDAARDAEKRARRGEADPAYIPAPAPPNRAFAGLFQGVVIRS